MLTVGTLQAKHHLGHLLDKVAQGETVVITKHGRPIARLVPPESTTAVSQVVHEMLADRDAHGPTLGKEISLRELLDEGRR